MDRLYMTYLTPPDAQYAQARLGTAVSTTTQSSIVIGSFTIPEDEAMLRQGSLIEFGQELMRVVTYDSGTQTAVVTRNEYGTVPSTYTTPMLMNLNPPYPRASVFEAVADNIIQLYPSLFTIRTSPLTEVSERVYALPDPLAVDVRTIWSTDERFGPVELHGHIEDYHPDAGGRALITNRPAIGDVWLKYARRMDKATDESDVLSDLGVDERWVNIIMAGSAADILVGRDIPAAHTEWVKNVLEAENVKVGTRMSISGGLRQYRNNLITEAMKEMKAEYRPKVMMRNAFQQVP
jgi:hypothetical protein